jgi:hypothetical protein
MDAKRRLGNGFSNFLLVIRASLLHRRLLISQQIGWEFQDLDQFGIKICYYRFSSPGEVAEWSKAADC